jgi:uncharacterized damage-inducible protein DinB
MKHVIYAVPAAVLFATVAFSQPPGSQMPGQKIGLATSLQRGYANVKQNLTQAAEKMPEADYSFKPGTTADVRPFGQVIAHVAEAQFGQCSAVKGAPNPMQGKRLEQELKTKAEIVKALADSFALCDEAFASTTDENATQFIKVGANEVTRAAALYGVIVHGNEIYGTGAVYLRSKNIVPPSTERQMGRGRGN